MGQLQPARADDADVRRRRKADEPERRATSAVGGRARHVRRSPVARSRAPAPSSSSGIARRGGRTRCATPTRSTSRPLPRPDFRAPCSSSSRLGALLVAVLVAPFRQIVAGAAGAAAGCAGAFVVFVIAAGVDWMWESTAVTLLALACGMLGAASQSRDVDEAAPPDPRRDRRARRRRARAARAGADRLPAARGEPGRRGGAAACRGGSDRDDRDQPPTVVGAGVPAARPRAREVRVCWPPPPRTHARRCELESENYENWLILGRIEVERGASQRRAARRPARAGAAPTGHRVPAGVTGPFSSGPGSALGGARPGALRSGSRAPRVRRPRRAPGPAPAHGLCCSARS